MLYLIGENLDKARAHYQAETGKIVQLMRGIYVDADADIDAVVLRNAVRIAHYLYPNAYLSAASATLLAPTRDGRLFISGKRNQRTRLRALEIIQNVAPDQPAVATAIVGDSTGEFQIAVSSMRQRCLEAFRQRSEHASAIDDGMRAQIALRLVEEYGSPAAAADAVWALARDNKWYREGEQAERYLLRSAVAVDVRNEAALSFHVGWHGQVIGRLDHDGFEWRWQPDGGFDLPLVQQRVPGRLPAFILSLLPEGWLEKVLKDKDERAMLRSGKRYMSNITISADAAELGLLPADTLATRLGDHTRNGIFTGTYAGPGRGRLEADFEAGLARLYRRADTPRLSGVQIKAPMFLARDGRLSPSAGLPFTHILKPAGTSGFQALPVIEYLAMSLAGATGLAVPAIALVPMPDAMPPALLVERFDIRTSASDTRRLALEDMCSVLDLTPDAKYDGTIERIARAIRPLSTAPQEDLLLLLKRALFAWLIGDGDMHLKNLALLKIASPAADRFDTIRLAPVYDAVTTRVFPGLEHDRMALKLNAKDDRLQRRDVLQVAVVAGLTAVGVNDAIDRFLQQFAHAADALHVPDLPGIDRDITQRAAAMIAICKERLAGFT
ncbi:serine/threonine-protein kinase HipA [Pseudosulfitobacter pseudonitzschiae]|uniref:Phosphatidylinositol kinase n=1 Tax=Pseudosulfitobacter pseudonitzschiae TaxID=1402135 RepID=A0A073IXH6_9RHOB|nr:HipA domain-containing protein [Pseudosulfitobacter pseudonitzschiae]KEJ94330.1 phosphatidylinositol kinase [Pseudosulfitobacter pseudonitzschiae]SHG21679.1 serine/threonine-protein kinase HipA [Pseudosulfitobacter pseudonitzschiae]